MAKVVPRKPRTFRRNTFKKKKMTRIIPRNPYNIHKFTRIMVPASLDSATTDQGYAYTFDLTQLPSYTEFTALYDQYMITGVKVTWYPQFGRDDTGVGGFRAGAFYTTLDFDDATVPTATTIVQDRYTKRHSLYDEHPIQRYFSPKTLNEVYRSAITTAYSTNGKKWLDCAYPDVPHFALKVFWGGSSAINFKINWQVKYYLAFKGFR